MALRDLLVHVDNDPGCISRIDVAVMLAAAHGAHLTGFHAMGWPWVPGYVEVPLPVSVLEEQRRLLDERARRAETRFHERLRHGGIAGEWRQAEGDIVRAARLHARYADLTVVGQGVDVEEAPAELAILPEEVVLGVGRPVLVVPRHGVVKTLGQRVLVAWNGSREATRAVHDALPILERAASVIVLSIDPDGEPDRRMPGADIALHLARHGITVEASTTHGLNTAVGDILLSRAFDLGADLIVMGAYGHSRLREVVLGGATRHMLQHMTVPVLMSH
jgi:nucleotide-binding universal stress UspA family protein